MKNKDNSSNSIIGSDQETLVITFAPKLFCFDKQPVMTETHTETGLHGKCSLEFSNLNKSEMALQFFM
jgi:hypothetical protein